YRTQRNADIQRWIVSPFVPQLLFGRQVILKLFPVAPWGLAGIVAILRMLATDPGMVRRTDRQDRPAAAEIGQGRLETRGAVGQPLPAILCRRISAVVLSING